MTLKDQINDDFIEAMKSANQPKKMFLGVIKGEIQNAESKPGFNGDESVLGIVKKMEKSLNECLVKGDDQSKVDAERELGYLAPYLPQMMSYEQIVSEVNLIITAGANNVGMIMGKFNSMHKGKADNNLVKEVAQELLV